MACCAVNVLTHCEPRFYSNFDEWNSSTCLYTMKVSQYLIGISVSAFYEQTWNCLVLHFPLQQNQNGHNTNPNVSPEAVMLELVC